MTYHYIIEGCEVAVVRRHLGTAYASNGNAHNPTQYYTWDARTVYGVSTGCKTRASAYEHARAMILHQPYYDHPNYPTRWVGVRHFREVAAEMKANYRGRAA